jgi:RimJ/RimL family protein N-acetyltransferase
MATMGQGPTVTATSIECDRVRLRKGRDDDADGLIETQTDVRVRLYLGGPRAETEVRAILDSVGAASLLSADGCYIVADKASDEMLGTITLSRRGPELPGHVAADANELELTYVFRPHAWRNGYATEAARGLLAYAAAELPEQPVIIVTQTANQPSVRLAERLGFSRVQAFEQYDAEQTLAIARLSTFLDPKLTP